MLGRATGAALPVPVADVVAYAKRALRAGERLDGSGGRTVYGLIERAPLARAEGLLPLGLADGLSLSRDVPADAPLTYAAVGLTPPGAPAAGGAPPAAGGGPAFALRLRREQDALW